MKSDNTKKQKRDRRHARIRAKVFGTSERPRLSVFKSNKHISAQLINDDSGVTLAYVHSKNFRGKTMMDKSMMVGEEIAKKAIAKNVKNVVFDRGGFIYTGNIKALADKARESGLVF